MSITLSPITPDFAAEVGDVDLSRLTGSDVSEIKQAFWKYAVLVFPDQDLTPEQHLAFSEQFGPVEMDRVLDPKVSPPRLSVSFADISNLTSDGKIWGENSRQRMYKAGNRLWHTDSSFKFRPGLCSLLYSRTIAPVGGHTEFADQRAAYDALPAAMKNRLKGLIAEHSIATSRQRSGFAEFTTDEGKRLPPVPQLLVRTIPESGRKSLYIASHAGRIFGMPEAEGRRPRTDRRAHRAYLAAAVRLHASLARERPRDVGQPMHAASRHRLRRPALGAGHAPHHGQRRGQHVRAGRRCRACR